MQAMESLWIHALGDVQRRAGVPMVFGGEVGPDSLHLTHFVGARTNALGGRRLARGSGLGGRVWNDSVPRSVADYESSPDITHEHDGPVRREGLRGITAVPVNVGSTTRGVLYAGTRLGPGQGDLLRDVLTSAAAQLARDITTEEDVVRRVMIRAREAAEAEERLRWLHAELRGLRARSCDPSMVRELTGLIDGPEGRARGTVSDMSARQVDVLTCVAQGAAYRVVAEKLGLSEQTIKAYMRDILVALGAHSRHEAVVMARSLGLIS